MASFSELLHSELPAAWAEPFTTLFGTETQVSMGPWLGPPPNRWIGGTWRVGDQQRRLWVGTSRELAFTIAGRLAMVSPKRLDSLLGDGGDPAVVTDAFGEWGNLAIGYLADLFRQAFGPNASATRDFDVVAGPDHPVGGSVDLQLRWPAGGGGSVGLVIE